MLFRSFKYISDGSGVKFEKWCWGIAPPKEGDKDAVIAQNMRYRYTRCPTWGWDRLSKTDPHGQVVCEKL